MSKGNATRERLLDVAEKHFAADGYEGASQRAIQREANVNAASANYYFGSKEALYQAVVERYLPSVMERRAVEWAAIPADLKGRSRAEAMLRALLGPHLEVATTPAGRSYGRIAARLAISGSSIGASVFLPHIQAFRAAMLEQLAPIFPGAKPTAIAQGLSFTVTLMMMAPFDANYAALVGGESERHGPAEWIEALTRFAMGGFETLCGPAVE